MKFTAGYLRSLFLLLLLSIFAPTGAEASHIAGAELTYKCLGSNASSTQYEITLKLYRDCLNGNAGAIFPDPLTFFFFETNSGLYHSYVEIAAPFYTPQIIPENWSACVSSTYNLCIEEGVYVRNVTLPNIPGGFDVAYGLCCRNQIVTNLDNPGGTGVTFVAHLPGLDEATCNSMPEFTNSPSLFLCAGQTYNFDHSAIDLDGDSLVYQLSDPYTGVNFLGVGASTTNPIPDNTNPIGQPPYQNVVFLNGYSYTMPFGQGSISIDPNTGYLTANPQQNGVYVVAISVLEYRNGILLSENKRDFQFHVLNCLPQGAPPVITPDLSTVPSSNDTIFAEAANNFCFNFSVTDVAATAKIDVEPVSLIFGGNGGFPPPYATLSLTGNNPVNGTVCWEPNCTEIGKTYELIISAHDSSDCENYNIALDTIYITIIPPPAAEPAMSHDLSGNQFVGDTILLPIETSFCYNFYITDTIGAGANFVYSHAILSLTGDTLNPNYTISSVPGGSDSLIGTLCWKSFCNVGATYMMTINGIDRNKCPPGNVSSDTVYFRVLAPPTFFPVIATDLSPVPSSNDTIFALAHKEFCFDFNVVDTSGIADSLLIEVLALDAQGQVPGNEPTASGFIQNDTLFGNVCWTPGCNQVGKTYMLIVKGIQAHQCWILRENWDTVYVRVDLANDPPPLISHVLDSFAVGPNEIAIEDAQGFCYEVTIEDTLVPSYLLYEALVVRMNGLPYAGILPVVNVLEQEDSLVRLEVCWEVECAYSNEDFYLQVIGKDTFDCDLGKQVVDSILVRHTETTPAQVAQCGVSVVPGPESVRVKWTPSSDTDREGYLVERSLSGSQNWTTLDTLWADTATQYMDFPDMGAGAWCFRVVAFDRCGNLSPPGLTMCTVFLEVEDGGFQSDLSWSELQGWSAGVREYEIWLSEPSLGAGANLWSSEPGSVFSAVHDAPDEAINCYRIRALENGNGCGIASWSNETCITFPPRLWFPNAFTPNADGLNDEFILPGLYVDQFLMRIYDRWGKLIFVSRDPSRGWKGTFDGTGKAVPQGVYMYTLEATGFDGSRLQRSGSVTLIR